jgi:hypothetical protein
MTLFATERTALSSLFPRGRFTRDEEGACVLTAKRAARAKDFLYVQDPGRKVGIFYVGNGQAYRNRLRGLIVGEVEAQGEGLIHVAWVPEVAERLPWFTRARPRNPGDASRFTGAHLRGTSGPGQGSGRTTEQREGLETPQEVDS